MSHMLGATLTTSRKGFFIYSIPTFLKGLCKMCTMDSKAKGSFFTCSHLQGAEGGDDGPIADSNTVSGSWAQKEE